MICVGLSLRGCPVLVVGAGRAAQRKILEYLSEGAFVTVCALQPAEGFTPPAGARLLWRVAPYEPYMVQGMMLVHAATNDAVLNEQIVKDARRFGVLSASMTACDAASVRSMAACETPALCVAVSTKGASPALAAKLARQTAQTLSAEWESRLVLLRSARTCVKQNCPPGELRTALLRSLDKAPEHCLLQMAQSGEPNAQTC